MTDAPRPGFNALPLVRRTAPERIYLCVSDDLDDRDEPFSEVRAEVTWARDEATRVAVPYVRADLVNAGTAVADERAAFEAWLEEYRMAAPDTILKRCAWPAWQARAALAAPKAEAPAICPRCHKPAANLFSTALGGEELDTVHCGCLWSAARRLPAPPAHQGATHHE